MRGKSFLLNKNCFRGNFSRTLNFDLPQFCIPVSYKIAQYSFEIPNNFWMAQNLFNNVATVLRCDTSIQKTLIYVGVCGHLSISVHSQIGRLRRPLLALRV